MVEEDQPQGAGRDQPLSAPQTGLESDPVAYDWVPPWIARHFRGGSVRARMAKGVAWSVMTGVMTRGLFVLVGIVVARLLREEAFGKWAIVQSTVGLLSNFAGMGIGQTLTKHIAELRKTDPQRAGRVTAMAGELAVISNLVIGIGCLASAGVIARRVLNAPDMAVPLALSSLMATATVLSTVFQCALAGFEAFRQIAFIRLAEMLATFATMTALTWKFGLVGTILGFTAGQIVTIAPFVHCLRGHFREHAIKVTMAGRWREIKLLWDYSLPSLLAALLISPADWCSKALVAQRADGFAQMSGYGASDRWRGLVGFIPHYIRLVALPVLSQLKGAGDVRRYRKAFLVNLAATAVMAVAPALMIAPFSPWVMSLYGATLAEKASYAEKWDILVVLLGVSVVQSLLGVFSPLFVSHGRVWWTLWFNMLWAALLVAGAVVLVPHMGVRGLVWPLLAAYLVDLVVQAWAGWVLLRRMVREADEERS